MAEINYQENQRVAFELANRYQESLERDDWIEAWGIVAEYVSGLVTGLRSALFEYVKRVRDVTIPGMFERTGVKIVPFPATIVEDGYILVDFEGRESEKKAIAYLVARSAAEFGIESAFEWAKSNGLENDKDLAALAASNGHVKVAQSIYAWRPSPINADGILSVSASSPFEDVVFELTLFSLANEAREDVAKSAFPIHCEKGYVRSVRLLQWSVRPTFDDETFVKAYEGATKFGRIEVLEDLKSWRPTGFEKKVLVVAAEFGRDDVVLWVLRSDETLKDDASAMGDALEASIAKGKESTTKLLLTFAPSLKWMI